MARRPATRPDDARDLAVPTDAPELPKATGKEPPEWIRIAPAGELRCRDGRRYMLDPAALVTRFEADRVDIAVDLGHDTVRNSAAPALAWIDRLEARPDGLWGHLREWLTGGREVLAARTHRYVSPAFNHDESGRVTWLHSVALVATPALAMSALLSARTGGDEVVTVAELAATLQLHGPVDRASCLAAVAEMASEAVPLVIHRTTLSSLAAVQQEFATFKAEVRSKEVHEIVEGAVKAMKITPAERADYVALCATDIGFDSVKRLFAVKQQVAVTLPSALDSRPAPGSPGDGQRDVATLSANEIATAATALLKERADKGLRLISFADAVTRIASGERNG